MAFQPIVSGANPQASDVQQIIDALTAQKDAGALALFVPISAPGALTAAINAVAGLLNGAYTYKVTFVTGFVRSDGALVYTGETAGGTTSASVSPVNQQVNLTSIPIGPTGTIARLVYRTAAGGGDGTQKLAFEIPDNTTTAWTDNIADANLGATVPTGNTTGSMFTLAADPTSPLHAATKQYVDAIKMGLDVKDSVRVATTANITLSGTQTIDGVAAVAGDRILVKDQTTGSQNGIYVVAAGAWARSADADTTAEVTAGMFVFVTEGTANGDAGFVLTTNDPITLGTTALTFTQFSGAGQIIAGAGISKSGNTLSVATGGVTDGMLGSRTVDQAIADAYANTGTLTQLLSWIVKTILATKGSVTNWYDAAAASISTIWAKFDATTGHKHTGAAGDAPKVSVGPTEISLSYAQGGIASVSGTSGTINFPTAFSVAPKSVIICLSSNPSLANAVIGINTISTTGFTWASTADLTGKSIYWIALYNQ